MRELTTFLLGPSQGQGKGASIARRRTWVGTINVSTMAVSCAAIVSSHGVHLLYNYCTGITTGWDETEVFMEVSSRRLAIVQHRHPPARGLLSLISLLSAFPLTGINRNQPK